MLTDKERKAYGWYPVQLVNHDYDPHTHTRSITPELSFDGDQVLCVYSLAPIDIHAQLAVSKALKLAEINRACDEAISSLAVDFPQTEVQSWDQQVREADQWSLDNNESVPLITAIAEARGLPLAELVSRIKAKAAAFAAASGRFIGRRQFLEDKLILITADTPDALAAVESIRW